MKKVIAHLAAGNSIYPWVDEIDRMFGVETERFESYGEVDTRVQNLGPGEVFIGCLWGLVKFEAPILDLQTAKYRLSDLAGLLPKHSAAIIFDYDLDGKFIAALNDYLQNCGKKLVVVDAFSIEPASLKALIERLVA